MDDDGNERMCGLGIRVGGSPFGRTVRTISLSRSRGSNSRNDRRRCHRKIVGELNQRDYDAPDGVNGVCLADAAPVNPAMSVTSRSKLRLLWQSLDPGHRCAMRA
jgi:hypothetical protein